MVQAPFMDEEVSEVTDFPDIQWCDEWGAPWPLSIIRGYWPVWSWRTFSFEWEPQPALLKQWIENGEIG